MRADRARSAPHPAAGAAGAASAGAPEELAREFAEADEQDVDFRGYTFEDWICIAFFWVMVTLVFLQFFSRYVLNDSFAWTEEMAVYCLICVVFIGAAACVRRTRHIQVSLAYQLLPRAGGRALLLLVDSLQLLFFAYGTWLCARYALAIDTETMTTVRLPKSVIYWAVVAGWALMAGRAVQVGWLHWRDGWSTPDGPAPGLPG